MITYQLMLRACFIPLSAALASCGGGGSDGGTPLTGRFMDSPVENLRYSTPSYSGRTNANGEFEYAAGEMVSFFVGDIPLGSTTGKATVTPFDLAGISIPTTKSQIWAMQRKLRHSKLSPMHKVINIAAFLQTIDDDGDPSNGIRIPEAVHTIATGMQMDFNKAAFLYEERPTIGEPSDPLFRDTFQLRILLAQGVNQGLWSGRRHVTQAHIALTNLYVGLGITPVFDQVDEFYLMYAGSTNYALIYYYTYDLAGNRDFLETDFNGTGVIDNVTDFSYDANQNLTSKLTGDTISGPFFMSDIFEYDDFNNKTRLVHDEVARRWEYQLLYNDYGQRIYQRSDHNGDGVAEQVLTDHWSNDGYLTSTETDNNDDGIADLISHYQYDTHGNSIRNELDTDADGIIDQITSLTNQYDGNGNLTLVQMDFSDDGVIDAVVNREYNARGELTLFESDLNNDGNPESVIRYQYDSQGNLVLHQRDTNGDGIYEFHERYTYDTTGNLYLWERDFDGDSTYDDSFEYITYDADGNALEVEFDMNNDGTPDEIQTYTYANGFLTSYTVSSPTTGDVFQTHTYVPVETMVPWREIVATQPELD